MLYVIGYLRKLLYRSHCKTKRYPICYELDCPYQAAHTVGVMEKFQFRFDTVPFCLRTVFNFIRFLTVFCFTVYRFVPVLVTVQCGMRIFLHYTAVYFDFHGHLVFPEVLTEITNANISNMR